VAKFLLVLATIADLALAALLIGVSGFLFGGGPESMHAGALAAAGYIAAVMACIAAPIIGFVLSRRGTAALALAIAWMPVAGALVALMAPAPY
jgi:hypothetical protein